MKKKEENCVEKSTSLSAKEQKGESLFCVRARQARASKTSSKKRVVAQKGQQIAKKGGPLFQANHQCEAKTKQPHIMHSLSHYYFSHTNQRKLLSFYTQCLSADLEHALIAIRALLSFDSIASLEIQKLVWLQSVDFQYHLSIKKLLYIDLFSHLRFNLRTLAILLQ